MTTDIENEKVLNVPKEVIDNTAGKKAAKLSPAERVGRYLSAELMSEPGYEKLSYVLKRAFDQAATGKGKERHANDLPFHEQPMQQISNLLNSPHGMSFQAIKKIQEGLNMPETERAVRELLGAIVYTAGIIIWLEENMPEEPFEVEVE